jgi:hypothetical protein
MFVSELLTALRKTDSSLPVLMHYCSGCWDVISDMFIREDELVFTSMSGNPLTVGEFISILEQKSDMRTAIVYETGCFSDVASVCVTGECFALCE